MRCWVAFCLRETASNWCGLRRCSRTRHSDHGAKIMTDDPTLALARRVCRTGYADLPASAVESARRDLLDTFGCMLGGSGSPGIDELFAVISRWGGLAESRVLLRSVSLPSPQAALLNASMGLALDFDDTLDTGGSIHPGVSVWARRWPSATALATSPGKSCFRPWRWGWTYRAGSRSPAPWIAVGTARRRWASSGPRRQRVNCCA